MLELKTSLHEKANEPAVSAPLKPAPQRQRRMMLTALVLLLVALVLVIYRDRDFWFPDADDADDLDPAPATVTIQTQPTSTATNSAAAPRSSAVNLSQKHHRRGVASSAPAPNNSAVSTVASNARTVLPPLEVEVVAGDYHRRVRPGTNSLRVDLQPGTSAQAAAPETVATDSNAANLTMNAAENLRISTAAAEVVTQPVRPGYPVLARQMKVQGSVILQALIGRDGLIQNLQVLTGPPILADAAEEAVRQWRFKPHYQNNQPVETQTSITVNFTISTN